MARSLFVVSVIFVLLNIQGANSMNEKKHFFVDEHGGPVCSGEGEQSSDKVTMLQLKVKTQEALELLDPVAPGPAPKPAPRPAPTPSLDPVASRCCKIAKDNGLVPYSSWGTTPTADRGWWHANNCNNLVGGAQTPKCRKDSGPGPTPAPPPAPTPSLDPVASLSRCCKIANDNGVVPGLSWGTTPAANRSWWDANNCNDLVGGAQTPKCPKPTPAPVDPLSLSRCCKIANDSGLVPYSSCKANNYTDLMQHHVNVNRITTVDMPAYMHDSGTSSQQDSMGTAKGAGCMGWCYRNQNKYWDRKCRWKNCYRCYECRYVYTDLAVALKWCCSLVIHKGVVPGISWGVLDAWNDRGVIGIWKQNRCPMLVGGAQTPKCQPFKPKVDSLSRCCKIVNDTGLVPYTSCKANNYTDLTQHRVNVNRITTVDMPAL